LNPHGPFGPQEFSLFDGRVRHHAKSFDNSANSLSDKAAVANARRRNRQQTAAQHRTGWNQIGISSGSVWPVPYLAVQASANSPIMPRNFSASSILNRKAPRYTLPPEGMLKTLLSRLIRATPARWYLPNVYRMHLIQHAIDTLSAGTYLEIGVEEGHTFSVVGVARKIGVDPIAPRPNVEAALRRPGAQYFATTSDEFFERMPQSTCHWESMSSL
jgi:hypothetical protein